MYRPFVMTAVLGAAVLALGVSESRAGWYSYGSSGGSYGGYSSYGSWGSSGGYGYSSYGSNGSAGSYGRRSSWGSHGSHGGLLSRLFGRSRRQSVSYASHGSWGSSHASYGSSGGSWGSYSSGYGSYGSSGGYGSHGSSGGGTYYTPSMPSSGVESYSVPSDAPAPPTPPSDLPPEPGDSTYRAGNALLTVNVPDDARVYVNGVATKSTGERRTYVSRGLLPQYSYSYEVRAEVVRDGRTVEETKSIQLRAGGNADLAFALAGASEETSLTLHVPADAKVYLAGAETSSTGPVRTFATDRLANGQAWADYQVRVEVERNGQLLTKERTISLKSGSSETLSFDFEAAQVATAR